MEIMLLTLKCMKYWKFVNDPLSRFIKPRIYVKSYTTLGRIKRRLV